MPVRLSFYYRLLCCACLAAVFLCGCRTIEKTAYAPSPVMPNDVRSAPVDFTRLEIELPIGSDIGIRNEYIWFCLSNHEALQPQTLDGAFSNRDLRRQFARTLQAAGYDAVGSGDFMFDDDIEAEQRRTRYRVGGRVIDATLDICRRGPDFWSQFAYSTHGTKGEISLTIEWHIFDAHRRMTVWRATTNGYARRDIHNPQGIALLFRDAFAMGAHNLAAEPAFYDLLVHDIAPPPRPDTRAARPRLFDTDVPVTITSRPLSTVPVEAQGNAIQNAAVTVQGGSGHGSGFFITAQGHILSSAHAVGNADRVRISDASGRGMAAEVLRRDRRQDVALLRLEAVPEQLVIEPLPIRFDWPPVGARVYALGTPVESRLRATLAEGIISAHRKRFYRGPDPLDMLQVDIPTATGRDGGALIDGYGNIIGLAMSRDVGAAADFMSLYTPIEDALAALGITRDEQIIQDAAPLALTPDGISGKEN